MRNSIKAVCVIIGAIIGAGFASGREIYIFFNVYGIKGYIGLILANIITGIVIYKVLNNIKNKTVENYSQYLKTIGIPKKLEDIFKYIVNIFLLISFYIMIAGFTAYFEQEFNIPHAIIATGMVFLCYITFLNNIDGIAKINILLIPFLIVMIMLIGVKSDIIQIRETVPEIKSIGNWLISSLEYASYNSILLIPILIGLKKYTKQKEKTVSIIVTIILFLLSSVLYVILVKAGSEIERIELPLIYIVKQFGKVYPYIYGIVIVSAIFTSAIASGYGFVENCSKSKKTYKAICKIICITAIPISAIGFADLVNLMYPVLGLIGSVQVMYIIFRQEKG